MDEVRLKIRKRAVPSHGRARLHTSMLTELGVQEGAKLEIINDSTGKAVTVTLFADSMVEEGYIRLSAGDLKSLGLQEDDAVTIKRKPPITEQIREEAGEAAERVSEGIDRLGKEAGEAAERVSDEFERIGKTVKREAGEAADTVKGEAARAYGRIVEEAAPITGRIEDVTKETVSRIREEVTPVTERVEDAAREAYTRIAESPLRERLSKAAESVVDTLKPDEEAKLKKVLEESQGKIQIVTVLSDAASDKLVKELELPPHVVLSAVQRNKEIIIPKGDTRLVKGDIVFLVGKEDSLRRCSEMLEG